VTERDEWRTVYVDMGFGTVPPAAAQNIANAYEKYLLSFEAHAQRQEEAGGRNWGQGPEHVDSPDPAAMAAAAINPQEAVEEVEEATAGLEDTFIGFAVGDPVLAMYKDDKKFYKAKASTSAPATFWALPQWRRHTHACHAVVRLFDCFALVVVASLNPTSSHEDDIPFSL